MARGAITVKIDGQYDNKDINRAIKDLNALKTQADPTTGAFGSLGNSMKAIGVAAAAFGGFSMVTDFLTSSMQTAIEDEKSMVALRKSMENLGLAAQNTPVEDWTKKLSLMSGTADDVLRPALARLLRSTGDVEESQKALEMALSISAATGKDVGTVANGLGKAYDGNAASLGRLGLGLDKATLKGGDMAVIMGELSAKFGGQWEAAAATYGGQLQRIGVAADEAKETIGYALLGAIENLSESFGGTGGAVEAITAFGDEMANIVTKVGDGVLVISKMVEGIGGLVNAMGSAMGATNLWGSVMSGAWETVVSTVGGPLYQLGRMYQQGQQDAQGAATSITQHGLSAARTAPLLAALAKSEQDAAEAAAETKAAMDALKASITHFNTVISQSQARDDFRQSIASLDVSLKGNVKSFRGVSEAAKENRDALRTMLGDAANMATTWGQQTGASADEIDAKYKTMRKKIIAGFKGEGFTVADIKAFMGKEHLWRTPAQDAVESAATAAKSVARPSFLNIGHDVASGAAQGISTNAWMVSQAARIMMLKAKAAAKTAIDSNSPSKVFAAIGGDIVDGLVEGLKSKDEKVKQASTDMMNALTDKAQEIVDRWDAKLASLKDASDKAKSDMASFMEGISSSIMGNLDLGAAINAAKEGGGSVLDAFVAQGKKAETFGQNLIDLTKTNLSQTAWLAVQQLGAERGAELTTAMLDAQSGQMLIDGFNKVYATTEQVANAVAAAASAKWYQLGVDQAQAAYNGFADNFGKGKPARVALENLMDRVANSLDRTVTVTVKAVYDAAGYKPIEKRAVGGPVGAGMPYIVGEKGPELFVPSNSGTIIPNGGSGGPAVSGGNSYNITVQAGVGDPRMIGQQVVEYIKRYESANGAVFAAA